MGYVEYTELLLLTGISISLTALHNFPAKYDGLVNNDDFLHSELHTAKMM